MENDTAPAWDGVPLNPERDGAHWIIGWNNSPFVAEWQADPNAELGGDYGWYDGGDRPDGIIANGWTYGGPCLTPSEVQAREAAAWAAGAEAMRESVTGHDAVEAFLAGFYGSKSGFTESIRDGLLAVRALPLPPMPATTQGGNADE